MKRLLSILGSIGLVATSASSVVSCDDGESAHKISSKLVYNEEAKTYGYDVSFQDSIYVISNSTWKEIKPKITVVVGEQSPARIPDVTIGDISQEEQDKLVEHNGDNSNFKITFPVTVFICFDDNLTVNHVIELKTELNGRYSAHVTIELPPIVKIGSAE